MSDREVPKKYRALYKRRKKSRKAAIRSFCLECVGYVGIEVKLCSDDACPLFKYRLQG